MLVGLQAARDVQQFNVTRWKLRGAAPQVSFAVTGVFRISFDPCEVPVHPRVNARAIPPAASFAPRHHPCNTHSIVIFLFDCIPTNNDHTSKSVIHSFDVWLTVHRISAWNKKPTRCHLVLYGFLLYKLLNMFRATLCPSSGADNLVVFLLRVV